MSTANKEIERKFLVIKDQPEILRVCAFMSKKEHITQIYIVEDHRGIIRIRRKHNPLGGTTFTLGIKSVGGIIRDETELPMQWISPETFDNLCDSSVVIGKPITKVRHTTIIQGESFEVDEFEGCLNGLVIIEKEFASEDAAMSWQLPEYLVSRVKEVTGDFRFTNVALAKADAPPKP